MKLTHEQLKQKAREAAEGIFELLDEIQDTATGMRDVATSNERRTTESTVEDLLKLDHKLRNLVKSFNDGTF